MSALLNEALGTDESRCSVCRHKNVRHLPGWGCYCGCPQQPERTRP